MALLIVLCAAMPFIARAIENKLDEAYTKYFVSDDAVEVKGVSVKRSNPNYYQINGIAKSIEELEETAEDYIDDLGLEYKNNLLDYYLEASKVVEGYDDYKLKAMYERISNTEKIFIINNLGLPEESLSNLLEKVNLNLANQDEVLEGYYGMSLEEREDLISEYEQENAKLDKILFEDDYIGYIEHLIENSEKQIEDYKAEIEDMQQTIIEKPYMEKELNDQIETLQIKIKNIEEVDIPVNEYRKENNVMLSSDDWRNWALNSKKSASYFFISLTDPVSEEEFYNGVRTEDSLTYKEYLKGYYDEINEKTEDLLVADNSLASGEPDMRYVEEGTRQRVENFLDFNILIMFLVIIFGGKLVSSDFKNGTVRLLFIRPKNRVKIIMSRLFGLLILTYALYFTCILINTIANGVVFGFADLGYPNYTISSGARGISFFAYLLPEILLFSLPVLFFAAFAYFLSIATKNTAASISIPFALYIASIISMEIMGYDEKFNWVSFTPLPYFTISSVIWDFYDINATVFKGICILCGLSIIFIVFANIILKKRDITN